MRIQRALASSAATALVLAGLLLVPAGLIAGQWSWPEGLVAIGVLGGGALISQLALAVWRPASFDVRMQGLKAAPERRQPWLDAVGLVGYICVLAAWGAFIPWDALRLHLLPAPSPAVAYLGLFGLFAGQAVSYAAVWENQFAAPTVHDQSSDGQVVIDTGVYRFVRHPLYAGNLVTFSGLALWLGSYAALAGVAVMLAFTIARIVIEERELRRTLPSYEAYTRQVRARLLPFVV